jgi:hypothetical protein
MENSRMKEHSMLHFGQEQITKFKRARIRTEMGGCGLIS